MAQSSSSCRRGASMATPVIILSYLILILLVGPCFATRIITRSAFVVTFSSSVQPDNPVTTPVVSSSSIPTAKQSNTNAKTTSVPFRTGYSPVKTVTSPVKTTTFPVKTTTSPVKSTTSPLKTSISPVKTTTSPLKTSISPIKTNTSPLKTSKAPVKTTTSPIKINDIPRKSSAAPVKASAPLPKASSLPLAGKAIPVKSNAAPLTTKTTPVQSQWPRAQVVPITAKSKAPAVVYQPTAIPRPAGSLPMPKTRVPMMTSSSQNGSQGQVNATEEGAGNATSAGEPTCDPLDGSWVQDPLRPAYTPASCPQLKNLTPLTSCMEPGGRTNLSWLYWSWKPKSCGASPRFNASDFLIQMKGKSIAFVGDSIMYSNFFPAFLCMVNALTPVVEDPEASTKFTGQAWRVAEYDVLLLRYWSPFMVEAYTSDDVLRRFENSTLSGDAAVNLYRPDLAWAAHVTSISLILFQSGHHWRGGRAMNRRFFLNSQGELLQPEPTAEEAFRIAVGRILQVFRIPGAATPYFLTISPRGPGNCGKNSFMLNSTEVAFLQKTNVQATQWFPLQMKLLGNSTFRMIDITHMTLFRQDGFVGDQGASKDCLHFCTPGVPDSWVDLFYLYWRQDSAFNKA